MWYSFTISSFNHIFLILCFSLTCSRCKEAGEDYWSDDFDTEQKCKLENRIEELSALVPSPCEDVKITKGEEKAFRECKIKLSNNLQKSCDVRDGAIWHCNRILKSKLLGPSIISGFSLKNLIN